MPALLNVCYKNAHLSTDKYYEYKFDYSHVLSCTSNIKRRLLPLSGIQGWREIGQINKTSTEQNRAVYDGTLCMCKYMIKDTAQNKIFTT